MALISLKTYSQLKSPTNGVLGSFSIFWGLKMVVGADRDECKSMGICACE